MKHSQHVLLSKRQIGLDAVLLQAVAYLTPTAVQPNCVNSISSANLTNMKLRKCRVNLAHDMVVNCMS